MMAFARPASAPSVVARMRVWSLVCASVVIVVGITVLLGWIFHVSQMMTVAAGITMKTNTSVGFILLGVALVLLGDPTPPWWARNAGIVFALIPVAIGLATLSQHLTGVNLGIDEMLFHEAPGAAATVSPNRMGPPAAICLSLLGIALVLPRRSRLGQAFIQGFALAAILIATIPILGYVFQVHELFGIARFTGIALHTAATFAVLAIGVLLARPETGIVAQFASADAGGLTLRRLLPACVVVPVLLNWLRVIGQDAGLYDAAFGRTLLTLAFIAVFSVLTFWTAATVSRQAAARTRAEEAEVRMKDQLVQALDSERTARETAEQSNRMKDEFLATLSHELRTPLHAILGWAHLLAQGALSPTDTKRAVDTIQRNAHLQSQLVNDLLDMSGISSGKLRLELQDVLLPSVIDAALSTAAPAAEAKGVRVERRVERMRAVRGDPARIQQVLWNLIANAIKFTPAGGRVTVSARESGAQAEVSVADTGIGIAPELLGHVFERFHQADSSITRQHGGLGLGLAIARQLAEMHGGTLEAASQGVGRGATFTLRVPLARSRAEVESASAARGETPQDGMLAGVRVLVVENDPDVREMIGRMLEDRRAEVHPVSGTSEALDALERSRFDVIVSDIATSDRDGHELIRTLRARGDELPAIALSAFAGERDSDTALAAGFQLHLTKPVRAEVLASAVARLAGSPQDVKAPND